MLAPYLAVLVFAVRGLARLPAVRALAPLLLFLAYYNAIHVITHGFNRYRLPVMPVLFALAAWGWRCRRGDAPVRRGLRHRGRDPPHRFRRSPAWPKQWTHCAYGLVGRARPAAEECPSPR